MMSQEEVIVVTDVTKRFRLGGRPPTVALDRVSLTVGRGEFLVLLGPSGCGKSTLLRLMSGLDTPTSGEVWMLGERVTTPRIEAAIVFQTPVLLPWRTILDNVLLPLEIRRRKDTSGIRRARQLLDGSGLGDFADHYPRQLSGGMRQRAAICRALVEDPPVLFMDEPFGALDAITRSAMNEDLYNSWRRLGKTIVFVTHDIAEAARLGTRVITMTPRPGRLARVTDIELPGDTYRERLDSAEYLSYLRDLERDLELSHAAT